MKKTLLTATFTVLYLLSWATNYVTLSDGNWNNSAIWSTDGGLTSCACIPPTTTGGNTITINHNVTLNAHLLVNAGSVFTVNSEGSLFGPTFNLETNGGANIQLNGPCEFLKIVNGKTNGTSGSTIHMSALVLANARVDIYAGTVELDGGFLYSNTGNFNVHPNGTFNMSNGSKMELANGNISNAGNIDLGAGCCMTTTGNWTNEATGVIIGSGSATTTHGNMKNFNVWSVDITWCSVGFDTGMPSPENCGSSNGTCNAVMLPVELVSFGGDRRGTYNDVYWTTASEHNSDYFELYRSFDGFNWELIQTEKAAGNSSELLHYSYMDQVIDHAVSYYRLKQFDTDGAQMSSGIVAIEANDQTNEIVLFPNPSKANGLVVVKGMNEGDQIIVSNAFGAKVMEESVETSNSSFVLQTQDLIAGMYIVSFFNAEGNLVSQQKLMIQ